MSLEEFSKIKIPDSCGVYYFKKGDTILYIGKATQLKSRIRSYFDVDILHTRGMHIGNMVSVSDSIEYRETRSVLEADLLEKNEIKKYSPIYNTKEKDDKSYFALAITEEDFPKVLLFRQRNLEKLIAENKVSVKKTFGPYPSSQRAKEALKLIRKLFPFRDKCEVYNSKKRPMKCFSYEIGLCPGICQGKMKKANYQKHIARLIEFLEGDGEVVRKNLEKDMQEAAKKLNFEEAQRIRDTLFALEHIQDVHLLHREVVQENFRIEAYDISHISGNNTVGVMTVLEEGIPKKSDYKKFKLKQDRNDDLQSLKEILERRFKHLEWGIPDMIVLDGDDRHINIALKVLQDFNFDKENFSPEIVAVTKDKNHKAKKIISSKKIEDYREREIILINSEAHRFAITYHRLLRKKSFI